MAAEKKLSNLNLRQDFFFFWGLSHVCLHPSEKIIVTGLCCVAGGREGGDRLTPVFEETRSTLRFTPYLLELAGEGLLPPDDDSEVVLFLDHLNLGTGDL